MNDSLIKGLSKYRLYFYMLILKAYLAMSMLTDPALAYSDHRYSPLEQPWDH